MRNLRVTKKQKRARAKCKRQAKRNAEHLNLRKLHFDDRLDAEKLRQFPSVARKKQLPFPRDVEVGFAGHYKDGKFAIQDPDTFVAENVAARENAWYWRIDKRVGRNPTKKDTGLLEMNAAISTGLSMVLAHLVEQNGEVNLVQNIMRLACESGMAVLATRTGYLPSYLALHPDSKGTMSCHLGLSPIDPGKHVLIGRSATGKKGRKGLRTLGDSFTSILRHDRAIGLPSELIKLPKENVEKRSPDDWAVAEEMDRVVREEIGKLPNGPELLKQVDEHQCEAAKDWLRRFRSSKAGVDMMEQQLDARRKKLDERERNLDEKTQITLQNTDALVKEAKLQMTEAQKSVDEANARAESLAIEVDELRDKANLFDQVVSLLAEVLDLPGVGLIARKMTTLWKKLEKIAPHIGLVNKLAAIAAVRSVKPSKPDPDQNKPGNRG